MVRLGFGKSKQKDLAVETSAESLLTNKLKELCGGDADLYGAMSRLMFLDPKKINASLDNIVTDAQNFEGKGDKLRAEVNYRIAGGISLSNGDANGVKTYFGKASIMNGDSHPEYQIIVKRSSEAVSIARRFYDEVSSVSVLT